MKNPEPREPPTHRGACSRSSSPAVLDMAERMAILMGFTWIYDIYIYMYNTFMGFSWEFTI